LLGYDFVVEYKKGQDNSVADALSRQDEDTDQEFTLSVISYPTLEWLEDLKKELCLRSSHAGSAAAVSGREAVQHKVLSPRWNSIL
jgi:hypothetical protein